VLKPKKPMQSAPRTRSSRACKTSLWLKVAHKHELKAQSWLWPVLVRVFAAVARGRGIVNKSIRVRASWLWLLYLYL
jgi:hypothetical protein